MKKSIMGTVLVALMLTAPLAAQQARNPAIDKYGNHLTVHSNSETDFTLRVYGQLPNIRLFDVQREGLNQASIKSLSSKLFSNYQDILNIDPAQITFRKADTDGQLWFVSYQQTVNDIPVSGTQIGYSVDQNGDIVALGTDTYQDIEVPTTPEISKQVAHEIAKKEFEINFPKALDAGTLTIYPETLDGITTFYLAWKVHLSSEIPIKNMVYFIDATNGKMINQFNYLSDHTMHKPHALVSNKLDTVGTFKTDQKFLNTAIYPSPIQSYNIHGTITGDYYPEHYYDTPVNTNFETIGIKVYNYLGQLIAQGNSNSNGYYSINFSTNPSTHNIHIPLQNNWVQVKSGGNVVKKILSFYPGTSVQKNADWSAGDGPNVKYHANVIHDYFKNTHNFNSMDYQMKANINAGSSVNGSANGTDISFGSKGGEEWARSSDVVYHEYTHNVIHHIYDGWIGGGFSTAMDEGLSDYFACTLNNDPNQGESVGVNRDLDNLFSYDEEESKHWNGQVIGGAAWYVRQYTGATVADKLVFKALQLSPQADTFSEFMQNMMDADEILYSGNHANDIYDAAIVHGIDPPLFPAPSVSINGPTELEQYEVGNWSATVSGGTSPYSYAWYKIYPNEEPFLVSTSSSYAGDDVTTFSLHLEVTYSGSKAGIDAHGVLVTGCGGQLCKEVSLSDELPSKFSLNNNYPNPFNPSTQINYALPEAADVSLKVYNIMGQEVLTLVNGNKSIGFHKLTFEAGNLSSGVYIARMEAVGESGKVFSKELKMQLVK